MKNGEDKTPVNDSGAALEAAEDETSIRAVLQSPGGGRIVTMGFPGLAVAHDGSAHIDPGRMRSTLRKAARLGTEQLLVLTEISELPENARRLLVAAAADAAIEPPLWLPIADYGIPDAHFLEAWQGLAPRFHQRLDNGATLGITCQYGAGRSGTIAAMLLIERGLEPSRAIASLRDSFAESIESPAQFDWVLSLGG